MTTRSKWRIAFLGATALAIGMEVKASFDQDRSTEPWTQLIVRYVPREVTTLAIGGLSSWLVEHFKTRYDQKGIK